NVPGPPIRFLTSPPPSSGGGKPGLRVGSGRSVVYLNHGGGLASAAQKGLSLPVPRSKNSPAPSGDPGKSAVQGRRKDGTRTAPAARRAAKNKVLRSG